MDLLDLCTKGHLDLHVLLVAKVDLGLSTVLDGLGDELECWNEKLDNVGVDVDRLIWH